MRKKIPKSSWRRKFFVRVREYTYHCLCHDYTNYEVIILPKMAGEEGFEPSLTDSESAVLPLDYSPAHQNYNMKPYLQQ